MSPSSSVPLARPFRPFLVAFVASAMILVGQLPDLVGAATAPGATDRTDVAGAVGVGTSAVRVQGVPGATGFQKPLYVTGAGDGSNRLFIVEQTGKIRIYDIATATILPTPFLDISSRISKTGERGLLGLAFHPSYETNGKFYIFYTDKKGNIVIAERGVSADPNVATGSERILLRVAHYRQANHNGGQLAFQRDGTLLIGVGDGGGSGDPYRTGQNRASLLGKILRIDVNTRTGALPYGIPSNNPYARSRIWRKEIWSFGLRNPWRFSVDRANSDLWIGDVGQSRYEEIDWSTRSSGWGRGRNYGWSSMEGRVCYRAGCSASGKTMPVAVYSHASGCSVIGGYVYRGPNPLLVGRYFLGDFCSGRIWTLRSGGASKQSLSLAVDTSLMITSFGEGDDGRLFLTAMNGGLYEITQ